MKKVHKIAIQAIPFAILFTLASTALGSGATTQWFPSEGTTCDYEISYMVTKNDGTRLSYTTFDVYDTTTVLYIYSSFLRHQKGVTETGIANGTRLTYRHAYTEDTISQWRRTTTILLDDVQYKKANFRNYNVNASYYSLSGANTTVPKFGFYTSQSQNFVDHFNTTKKLGEQVFYPYNITAFTQDRIIATNNFSFASAFGFDTYIADATGKILQYIRSYHDPGYAAVGIFSTSLITTAVEPTEPVPSVPSPSPFDNIDTTILILFGAAACMGLTIGALVGFTAGKKKRA
jgi:hypothetical protein